MEMTLLKLALYDQHSQQPLQDKSSPAGQQCQGRMKMWPKFTHLWHQIRVGVYVCETNEQTANKIGVLYGSIQSILKHTSMRYVYVRTRRRCRGDCCSTLWMINERSRPPIKHYYCGQILLLTYTFQMKCQSKWHTNTSSWVRGNVGHNMSVESQATTWMWVKICQ
jgi:hypothetical protein